MGAQQLIWQSKDDRQAFHRTTYGGDECRGKRKIARPFAANKWIHVVLKLEKHRLNFFQGKNRVVVSNLLRAKAKLYGICIADAVVMKDHIHIKVKSGSRTCFQNFLRTLTGGIARTMTRARRGVPFGTFWRGLTYTRVLKTAKELLYLRGYFTANRIERQDSYEDRAMYLDGFHDWVKSIADSTQERKTGTQSEVSAAARLIFSD